MIIYILFIFNFLEISVRFYTDFIYLLFLKTHLDFFFFFTSEKICLKRWKKIRFFSLKKPEHFLMVML